MFIILCMESQVGRVHTQILRMSPDPYKGCSSSSCWGLGWNHSWSGSFPTDEGGMKCLRNVGVSVPEVHGFTSPEDRTGNAGCRDNLRVFIFAIRGAASQGSPL